MNEKTREPGWEPSADGAPPEGRGEQEGELVEDGDGGAGSETVPEQGDQGGAPDARPQTRSCKTGFRFTNGRKDILRAAVAGEFNGWSTTAHALADPDGDGTWDGSFQLKPGSYGYKIVYRVKGEANDRWILDPGNPERKYVGNAVC